MLSLQRWHYVVVGLLMTAAAAAAQGTPPPQSGTVPQGNMWSHGTTLNVFSGSGKETQMPSRQRSRRK